MSVKQRKPIPKRRKGKPRRVSVPRDPRFLRFLRVFGKCEACLRRPDLRCLNSRLDPAHGPVNGLGSKGSDYEAIPLGRIHHDEMEELRWPAFCHKYGLDRDAIVARWNVEYTKYCIRRKENNGKR